MVCGPDEFCHLFRGSEVGTALEPNGEAVHVGPPRLRSVVVVHPLLGMPHGQGRHHRRVEPTGNEQAVGHVAHQMRLNGSVQLVVKFFGAVGVLGQGVPVHPIALVSFHRTHVCIRHRMSGRKRLDFQTDVFDRLHFRSNPSVAISIAAIVQGDDANRVSPHQPFSRFWLMKDKCVHALEVVHQVGPVFCVQREDDLTIGGCGE